MLADPHPRSVPPRPSEFRQPPFAPGVLSFAHGHGLPIPSPEQKARPLVWQLRRMDTVLELKFATAKSASPSPSMSALVTDSGKVSGAYSTCAAKVPLPWFKS